MDRIDEGMQQPDGDAFHPSLRQHRDQRLNRRLVQRQQDLPGVVQPLRHRQPQVTRHQWLRQHDVQIVLVVTAFVAHRDDVTKALRRDQRGAGALAFDYRVGRQRGPMNDQFDVARCDARGLE